MMGSGVSKIGDGGRDGTEIDSMEKPWLDDPVQQFLGGEVVVDCALRIQRELAPIPAWVTAYANDVFGYVASERVRREGGYEVDGSMIYYNQPR